MTLNERAAGLCAQILADLELLRGQVQEIAGATVIDLGVKAAGGLEAGRRLAEVCLAGLGRVSISPGSQDASWPRIGVRTDHPLRACMASQYAGWQVAREDFFGMASGPMRAAAAKEELFQTIGQQESPSVAIGVLETSQLPSPDVCEYVAEQCGVPTSALTLLVARTASQAGGLQIVARSLETALHKLHELGFDLTRIDGGYGSAPLPPVANSDIAAIGRTNDAILYGGTVTLWLRGDDASLQKIGPQIPSKSSPDHGAPFAEIFERYDRDFYKIDGSLFSPAQVTLMNLDSGNSFTYGVLSPEVVRKSFEG